MNEVLSQANGMNIQKITDNMSNYCEDDILTIHLEGGHAITVSSVLSGSAGNESASLEYEFIANDNKW